MIVMTIRRVTVIVWFEEWGPGGQQKKIRGSLEELASPLAKIKLNPTDLPAIPYFGLARAETEISYQGRAESLNFHFWEIIRLGSG
ncbi:hypothetical protein SeLEV6574_g07476 [Synchytrium endobioticum]|uniref:Uncharacterized protein n=1 Tax=Synchytrium endobioticum TaxID=286115 RepID=A0A507CLJ1_9FUNG|nr:hypothetical protein SeLEV6574_g07476 [Synchytrium endobioticum]